MWVSFVETLLASLRLHECTINFHTCDVMLLFKIPQAHTPVRGKPDLPEMKNDVMVRI